LQPGNSLISPKLTLSVGFSMSIALHAATKLGGSWLLPRWYFSHRLINESHSTDHDSDSSGHANTHARHRLSFPLVSGIPIELQTSASLTSCLWQLDSFFLALTFIVELLPKRCL